MFSWMVFVQNLLTILLTWLYEAGKMAAKVLLGIAYADHGIGLYAKYAILIIVAYFLITHAISYAWGWAKIIAAVLILAIILIPGPASWVWDNAGTLYNEGKAYAEDTLGLVQDTRDLVQSAQEVKKEKESLTNDPWGWLKNKAALSGT